MLSPETMNPQCGGIVKVVGAGVVDDTHEGADAVVCFDTGGTGATLGSPRWISDKGAKHRPIPATH